MLFSSGFYWFYHDIIISGKWKKETQISSVLSVLLLCAQNQDSRFGILLSPPILCCCPLPMLCVITLCFHSSTFSPHRLISIIVSKGKSSQRNGLSWLEFSACHLSDLELHFKHDQLIHISHQFTYLFIFCVDLIFSS